MASPSVTIPRIADSFTLPEPRPWWKLALRSLSRNPSAQLGLGLVVLVTLVSVFGPLFTVDPLKQDILERLRPPTWIGGAHPLGTDETGRDLLARVVHGSRVSLLIALTAVAVSGTLGITLGMLSGYFGGWVDRVIMRVADIQLAFPFVMLAISIIAVLGPNTRNLIVALGLWGWVVYARVIRGQVLTVREMQYVEAAKALGAPHARIIVRHIFPNSASPMIVIASFAVAQMIVLESVLSFLGLGVQPPQPSWGAMLATSRDYLATAWWLATFPGLAIMITVLGINLCGDWVRDLLDPRLSLDR